MAHVADENLWNDLVNASVVVHLVGTTPREIATWLKKEYWEGKCTMPDSALVQKIEAATNKGFLRHRRFHGVVKNELRTLQPHERVRLERKAQQANRKALRVLAQQARLTSAAASTLTSSVVEQQTEQCWGEHDTDQAMRYPAAS